jgi:hypothetical protein
MMLPWLTAPLWSLYLARTRIVGAATDRPDRHPRAAEAGAGWISTCWGNSSGFNVKRDDRVSGIDTKPVPKFCRDDHVGYHCRDRDFKTRLSSSQTEACACILGRFISIYVE